MRILCHLLGCCEDDEMLFCCRRCGAWQEGEEEWLPPGPVTRILWWAKSVPWHVRRVVTRWKCGQCGRHAINKYQWDTEFCCPKCHDEWLPF